MQAHLTATAHEEACLAPAMHLVVLQPLGLVAIGILHQMFNMFLLAEAVPKRILDLMNVEGLTRENVASHLQVLHQQNTLCTSFHAR